MSLSTYNMYAGFSGLQPLDSVFWLGYSVLITTFQMGWVLIMDQDAPMVHAAKVVNHHPKLEKFVKEKPSKTANKVDIYKEETLNLGFNIADYYLFSK